MSTFSIEETIYQTDRQTPEQRLKNNICHLLHGEFVFLKGYILRRNNLGNGMFGIIGQVQGDTKLFQPVTVSCNVYDPETKQKVKRDIKLERYLIYHMPSNIWTKMMFYDGTLVKPQYEDDIFNDPEVENQLSYDSITRTWNGNEKTPAGNRRNNKKRSTVGFNANASNPFLVMIQSKL